MQFRKTKICALSEIMIALARTSMGDRRSWLGAQFVLPLESTPVAVTADINGRAVARENLIDQRNDPGAKGGLECGWINIGDSGGELVATRGEGTGFSSGQHPQIAGTLRWCNCQLLPGAVAGIDAPLGRSGDLLAGRPVRGDENLIVLKLTQCRQGGLAPVPVI